MGMSSIMSTITPPVTLHFLLPTQQLVPASIYFWHFQNRLITPSEVLGPLLRSLSPRSVSPLLQTPQVTGKQNAPSLRYLSPGTEGSLPHFQVLATPTPFPLLPHVWQLLPTVINAGLPKGSLLTISDHQQLLPNSHIKLPLLKYLVQFLFPDQILNDMS